MNVKRADSHLVSFPNHIPVLCTWCWNDLHWGWFWVWDRD